MSQTIRLGIGFALTLAIAAFSGKAEAQVGFGGQSAGFGNNFAGQSASGYGYTNGFGGGSNQGFGGGFSQGFGGGFSGNQQMNMMQQRQTYNNMGGLSSLIQRQAFRRNGYGVSSVRRGRR